MDSSQQQVEQQRSQLTGSLGNRQAEQEIGGQGRGRRWEAQLPRLEAKPLPTRTAGVGNGHLVAASEGCPGLLLPSWLAASWQHPVPH